MRIKPLLCGLALASSLVATNAYAETLWEGLEMRVGVSAPVVDSHTKIGDADYEHADDIWAGFSGTLSFGYRWGQYGLYLDQDLGGIWWQGEGDLDPAFIGGTYVTFRGLICARHDVEIDLGFGVGTMYSGGDKNKGTVIVGNKDGDHSAAFAMKFEFGLTYYLIPNTVGVGVTLDYNLGLNFFTMEDVDIKHLIHHINPGLHVVAQF